MRHRTTGYDGMAIPRVKGKRREIRRILAQRSKEILERYRRGERTENGCPLEQGLAGRVPANGVPSAVRRPGSDAPSSRLPDPPLA
jgi:hypothetical protein